ncbi:MAG: hypothetical protein B6229_00605 [Spirochaetaceae bacterium 4572_7]|nr:MAG: hypothetical protein B6229_00605 [Spirochaetaceae bacterium 4572_7]
MFIVGLGVVILGVVIAGSCGLIFQNLLLMSFIVFVQSSADTQKLSILLLFTHVTFQKLHIFIHFHESNISCAIFWFLSP